MHIEASADFKALCGYVWSYFYKTHMGFVTHQESIMKASLRLTASTLNFSLHVSESE